MLSHFKQQQNVIVQSSLEIRVSVGERKILTTYLGVSFRKRERLTEQNSEYICSISLNGNNDWLRAIHQYVYTKPYKRAFYNKCNKSRFTIKCNKNFYLVTKYIISIFYDGLMTFIIFKPNIMICQIYCLKF